MHVFFYTTSENLFGSSAQFEAQSVGLNISKDIRGAVPYLISRL